MAGANIRRGLVRGWIVLTVVWLLSVSTISAWWVFGAPPCYAFDSIALNGDYKGEHLEYVKNLRDELLKTGPLCGIQTSTQLLGLEAYAKDKAISQVSVAWKEPGGWSTDTQAELDVLDGDEITVSRIHGDITKYVYEARLHNQILFLIIAALLPFLAFGFGAGLYWTLIGFQKS